MVEYYPVTNYSINLAEIEFQHFCNFQSDIIKRFENMNTLLDSLRTNEVHKDDIVSILKIKKELRLKKTSKQGELMSLRLKYTNVKSECNKCIAKTQEIYDDFMLANKLFKKYLDIYCSFESRKETEQTVYIQFFTKTKRKTDRFSVCLLRDIETKTYELLKITPEIPEEDEIRKQFNNSNELSAMCLIRQVFLLIKSIK